MDGVRGDNVAATIIPVFLLGTGEDINLQHTLITNLSGACTNLTVYTPERGPRISGSITKSAIDDRVGMILGKILERIHTIEGPIEIVLTGFSQGGADCLRLAHAISQMHSILRDRLKVKIIAIDPVAGPMHKAEKEVTVIPDIVTDYTATLSIYEPRRMYQPQDLKRMEKLGSSAARVTFLPFYGSHSIGMQTVTEDEVTACGVDRRHTDAINAAARIHWNLTIEKLKSYGVTFDQDRLKYLRISDDREAFEELPIAAYTPQNYLNDYFNIMLHHKSIEKYALKRYIKTVEGAFRRHKTERHFSRFRHYYVKDPNFFLNQHHRDMFKIIYPHIYDYFFDDLTLFRNPNTLVTAQQNLQNELDNFKTNYAEMFVKFENRYLTGAHGSPLRSRIPSINMMRLARGTLNHAYKFFTQLAIERRLRLKRIHKFFFRPKFIKHKTYKYDKKFNEIESSILKTIRNPSLTHDQKERKLREISLGFIEHYEGLSSVEKAEQPALVATLLTDTKTFLFKGFAATNPFQHLVDRQETYRVQQQMNTSLAPYATPHFVFRVEGTKLKYSKSSSSLIFDQDQEKRHIWPSFFKSHSKEDFKKLIEQKADHALALGWQDVKISGTNKKLARALIKACKRRGITVSTESEAAAKKESFFSHFSHRLSI